MFLPFVQESSATTRQFGGTGLGLTISRRLARAMGGDLTCASRGRGLGASFRLSIPLIEAADEAPAVDATPLGDAVTAAGDTSCGGGDAFPPHHRAAMAGDDAGGRLAPIDASAPPSPTVASSSSSSSSASSPAVAAAAAAAAAAASAPSPGTPPSPRPSSLAALVSSSSPSSASPSASPPSQRFGSKLSVLVAEDDGLSQIVVKKVRVASTFCVISFRGVTRRTPASCSRPRAPRR